MYGKRSKNILNEEIDIPLENTARLNFMMFSTLRLLNCYI